MGLDMRMLTADERKKERARRAALARGTERAIYQLTEEAMTHVWQLAELCGAHEGRKRFGPPTVRPEFIPIELQTNVPPPLPGTDPPGGEE